MRKEYDVSKARRGPVVPVATCKTRITIWLDDDVLDWFRAQVHAAGAGNYQPCAHRGDGARLDAGAFVWRTVVGLSHRRRLRHLGGAIDRFHPARVSPWSRSRCLTPHRTRLCAACDSIASDRLQPIHDPGFACQPWSKSSTKEPIRWFAG
jgi:hypothetical protein